MKYCIIPSAVGQEKDQVYVNAAYARLAMNSGMSPVLIPGDTAESIEHGKLTMQKYRREEAMLLLTGGADVEPTAQGFENYGSRYCNPGRDKAEEEYLKFALSQGMFVFGICRGLQLMSIVMLKQYVVWWQHINSHAQEIRRNIAYHAIDHGPFLDFLVKNERVFVNSLHHQAIEAKAQINPGDQAIMGDYTVTVDGSATHYSASRKKNVPIFEAIRIAKKGKNIAAAVQWHPEELADQANLLRVYADNFLAENDL